MYYENSLVTELNPTFLFTWKGTRNYHEQNYHSHEHIEMAFVLSGVGKYRIDDVVYDVKEGDILILNPGVKHQSILTSPATPTTEFFVGFTDIKLKNYPPNYMMLKDGSPIFHTTGELRQKLYKLCMAIAAEYSVCEEGRYFMLNSYLVQMLLLIIREQTHAVKISTGYSFDSTNKKYIVQQILNYLSDHYNEKISLDQIAENMYLSPFYISKIFKIETGDTPIRFLINLRLEHAKELLEQGFSGSIKEVAAQVGYEDVYHFSKVFKKKYGISPSRVREEETKIK
ncbi:MAG: AraC family transcriptional regulator [Clostridiales bacterium]|nr:AraC family transcriptional regulator [Clostridiales bacterium]